MTEEQRHFVPALGFRLLTPLYDAAIALTMREGEFRKRLLEQLRLQPGHHVLDFGSGTGTLAIEVARRGGVARVVGLDVDPDVLAIARSKGRRAAVEVEWVEGSITAPPFASGSFDRIVTSLVLHHLTIAEKHDALVSARRLLKPRGELHIVDFGKPHTAYTRLAASLFRHFDGSERTGPNLDGRLPDLLGEAGFGDVALLDRMTTAFGTLEFLRARRGGR